MQEFIVPEDGIVVKTNEGSPVLTLEIQPEGNILKMFSANGEPKIALGTHENSGMFFIGDASNNSIVISVSEDVSEIGITNSGKNITLAIDKTGSEIRFVNENDKITNKIYVEETGGQIGLADNEGNLCITTGATEKGGLFHLMNKIGETVISLNVKEDDNGQVSLLDKNGNILIFLDCNNENGTINLLDKTGKIIWSTIQ